MDHLFQELGSSSITISMRNNFTNCGGSYYVPLVFFLLSWVVGIFMKKNTPLTIRQ